MNTETAVVAAFRDLADAEAAATELTANAFAEDHIHITTGTADSWTDTPYPVRAGHVAGPVWNWFQSIFGRDDKRERRRYDDVVREGKVLLGLDTPQENADMATEILSHHSPVHIERVPVWKG
ncbi:MAG: hypothetical protein JOZ62_14305 [Acidobacteriaceae bacterium]|nr:hypothetical protein [Acidobacteriaceae bacterium]